MDNRSHSSNPGRTEEAYPQPRIPSTNGGGAAETVGESEESAKVTKLSDDLNIELNRRQAREGIELAPLGQSEIASTQKPKWCIAEKLFILSDTREGA